MFVGLPDPLPDPYQMSRIPNTAPEHCPFVVISVVNPLQVLHRGKNDKEREDRVMFVLAVLAGKLIPRRGCEGSFFQ